MCYSHVSVLRSKQNEARVERKNKESIEGNDKSEKRAAGSLLLMLKGICLEYMANVAATLSIA